MYSMPLQLNWIGPNNTDLIELTNNKSLLIAEKWFSSLTKTITIMETDFAYCN